MDMTSIWNQKEKPGRQPTCDEMDMGVGVMFKRYHKMESLLVEVIRLDEKLNGEDPEAFVEAWSRGECRFYDVQRRYVNLQILDGARCESLDRMREGRNHFAHNYNGKTREFGRLWDLVKQLDGMIAFLEHVKKNRDSGVRKMENMARTAEAKKLRKSITDCMSGCRRDGEGWIHMAELGKKLRESGVTYDGKLLDVCRELGFNIRERPGIDPKEAPLYQIR